MKKILLITFILAIVASSAISQQCLSSLGCDNFIKQYPSGTFSTTSTSWSVVNGSNAMNAGNWTLFSVTNGNTYEWSYCESYGGVSTAWDAQLTLYDYTNSTRLCFSTDVCGTNGNAPYISWTATFTGTVRLLTSAYISGSGCKSNTSSPYNKLVWRQSATGGGCTPPSKPTGLTASASSSSQINLSWNSTAGAVGYDVHFCDGTYIGYTTNASYSVTGLSPNTNYQFKINAQKDATCTSGYTSCFGATTPSNCTPPSKPTGLTASASSSSQINLSWNSTAGAVGYDVHFCDGTYIGYTTNASYSVTGLSPNTNYQFKINAQKDATCTSGYTSCFGATTPSNCTPPSKPTGLTATAVSSSQINLSWNAVSGAIGFDVSYCDGTYIDYVTGTTYTHTDRVENTTYSYIVQAQKSATCVSGFTTCVSARTPSSCTPPAKPTGLTATAVSSSEIDLSWAPVSGAIGYDIYYCDGNYIDYTTSTSYQHTGRVENITYSYKIAAQKSAGCISPLTSCVEVRTPSSCTPPAKPTGLTATAVSSSEIDLSWSPVSGAIGYDIYYCDGNYIDYTTSTLFQHTGRADNTTYSYKISAQKSANCVSTVTSCIDARTPPQNILTISEMDPTDLLGIKKPLLLIHGIQLNGIPSDPDINIWNNFVLFFNNDPDLTKNYKIYYVRYYSNLVSVSDLGYDLRLELDKKTEFAGKQITIVAHSMGGLVARAFMNKTVNGVKGGERIEKLITLGTPHHGSPMSNGDARYSLLNNLNSDLVLMYDQLVYTKDNPDYYQYNRSDLRWDNYDNLFDYNKYLGEKNYWLEGSTMNEDRTYDNKIIAYAGSYTSSDYNFQYSIANKLTEVMFDFRFSKIEISDGIVPYSSASYEGHSLKKKPRFLYGYNHSKLAKGKGNMDLDLFGLLKLDILEETTVSILMVNPNESWDYEDLLVNGNNDKIFEIQNMGSKVLNITDLSISGVNSGQFEIVSPTNSNFTLAANQIQDVIVRFNPTTIGVKNASLDIANNSDNASPIKSINITGNGIIKSISLATITTTEVFGIDLTSASSGGTIISDGNSTVTSRGVCWSTATNPTITNSITSEGDGIGTFTSRITGLISGSTYHVRAYATNAAGTAYGADIPFVTNVNIVVPSITTNSIYDLKITEASSGGKIISDGGATVSVRGVCWSTSINPTIANSKTSDGSGIGIFSSNLTGLTAGTIYHVRAFATNSKGTSYGNDIFFTTNTDIVAPTISTINVYNLKISEANSGGNIISDGGSSIMNRGVCWSISVNPTISNTKTSDGTGVGVFSSLLTGLSTGATYHVRAYATNIAGTAYGEDFIFTTPTIALTPTLSTKAVSAISTTNAISGGIITSDGDDPIIEKGVCWSLNINPTILNSKSIDGTGNGSYSSNISGLTSNTTYHVRAYATNSVGTGYGSDIQFSTLPTAPIIGSINQPSCTQSYGSVVLNGLSIGGTWTIIRTPGETIITGSGSNTTVSGLDPGTYTFQVTNAAGSISGSSAIVTINAQMMTPTVMTSSVIDATQSTASSGGSVISDGGSPVTARGVCWSTTSNPTILNSKTSDGLSIGTFTSTITGLANGLTYHIRAYATNCEGIAYGSDIQYIHNSTGIEDIQGDEVSVFPNPVSGKLNIVYKDENFETIMILNSQGRLMSKEKVIKPSQQLDFSIYDSGLYILEFIKKTNEVKRIKVIKH